jgi:hypothetical protein
MRIVLGLVLLLAITEMASAYDSKIGHPSFLEAAVFFLTSAELHPSAHHLGAPYIRGAPTGIQVWGIHGMDGRLYPPVPNIGSSPDREFQLTENAPCIVTAVVAHAPVYTAEYFDFNEFPAPDTATALKGSATLVLGNGAICFTIGKLSPQGMAQPTCRTREVMGFATLVERRLAALGYIRNHFCPGLREPPLSRKPY